MAIFLNIFSQYSITDNIAIFPGYISVAAKLLKECRSEGRQLGFEPIKNKIAITKNERKYHSLNEPLLRCTPKIARDRLLDRPLIVYVTNPNLDYWCCTFIFNMRKYIIKEENETQSQKKTNQKNDFNFELPGYFGFNPMQDPTKYQEVKNDQGLPEFLHVIYEHYWNKK